MQIIEELIDLISNNKETLENILLKTKVLAYKLKNDFLIKWINNELEGYSDMNEVPKYRIVPMVLKADITDGQIIQRNMTLPTDLLPEKIKNFYSNYPIVHSISSLTTSINSGKGGFKLELDLGVAQTAAKSYGEYVGIIGAYCYYNEIYVTKMIITIKNKLLDFLLEINDSIEDESDINENKEKIDSEINNFFKNATVNGDVNFLYGNGNIQNITVSNKKDDLKGLRKELEKLNLQEEYINELEEIINNNNALDKDSREFSQTLKEWVGKIASKSLDKVTEIGVKYSIDSIMQSLNNYFN